jgi:hypothetical protein
MDKKTGYAPPAVQPPWERQSWLGTATLESVAEVNEQVLALLREQCAQAEGQPSLIRDVGSLLLNLDARSMRYAAASAVLLVDAQFADARAWSEAIVGAVNDRLPFTPATFFTVAGTVAVMRLVVAHAWHLARSEPAAARLLLGLSAANVAVIGGCTLSRLTHLAESRTEWLRPRWESRPNVWCNMLRTARAGDSRAVERLRVRTVQLLAADAQSR